MTKNLPLTAEHRDLILGYVQLMEEIKARTGSFYQLVKSASEGRLNPRAAEEYGYLQLRIIYETIALCCLLVHNETKKENGKIHRKFESPDEIFDLIEASHKDFFPRPVEEYIDTSGKRVRLKETPLTKDDLIEMRGRCGGRLHRLHLKQALAQSPPAVDFAPINDQFVKIRALLNIHVVAIKDTEFNLFVTMRSPPKGEAAGQVVHRSVVLDIVQEPHPGTRRR